MSLEKQAAVALLKERFKPIFKIAAHKHAEFLADAKGDELIAMSNTFDWIKDMVDSYREAETYFNHVSDKE